MTNTRRDTSVSHNGDDRLKPVEIIEAQALPAFPHLGQLKSASKNGTCQGDPTPSASGGFLLLNFKSPYRDSLALSLRLRRHMVFVPEEQGKTYADLTDEEIRNPDYVYCDLTRRVTHDEFQALCRICNVRKRDGMPLFVACWLLEKAQEDGLQLTVERFFRARIVIVSALLHCCSQRLRLTANEFVPLPVMRRP